MVHAYTVGSYRMGYTLGVGTFGRVKLALHEKTGQKVAIKVINRAKMQSLEMNEKVAREISILQRLGPHPHIIRLYELIDTPTDIFMVTEYVPGGELFDYIVQKSRLQEGEARRFFRQIVSGVDFCHQRMICHRDLKPENVLLNTDSTVKVGDFGLSNFMRDGEFLKTSCGSPNYAAPEVVSGKAYAGPEVDVWSCGVILFALLCGSLPFDDENVSSLFKKIRHGNFSLPGHISENARKLIIRMLLVDPAARISIREIRRHPWTKGSSSLPSTLWAPPPPRVDEAVLAQVQALGYEVDSKSILKYLTGFGSVFLPKAVVAYNLLADKKRAASNKGGELPCWGNEEATLPHAFSKEVRKRQSAAAVFHSDYSPFGVMSFSASRDLFKAGASRSHIESQPCHPSQVAPKWKVRVESSLDPITIMTVIFNTLRSLYYEWHIVNQYKIWCRPLPIGEAASGEGRTVRREGRVVLCVQVFKLFAGKSAVNVQAFDGSLSVGMTSALCVLFSIYRALIQQQTAARAIQKCAP